MMGLMPHEFWQMQPCQFAKMVSAYSKKQQHDREQLTDLAAFIVASIYNQPPVPTMEVKFKKRKEYSIGDFTGRKYRQQKKQTPEEMLNRVKALNAALGGKGGDLH